MSALIHWGIDMAFQLVAVEDEPEIAGLLGVVLASPHLTLHTAGTGSSGLALIRETGPNLVILDVMLPGKLDGWDVFDALRADPDFASTPVIMLTVLRHPGERLLQFADNALNQYLTKPFDPLTLRGHIDRMLGQPGLWPTPSASFRSVLGVLNEAAEALDLDRRYEPPKAANTDSETP